MTHPLYTRHHQLAERIDADDVPASAHHYVIGADLMAAMGRADVQRSIGAMIAAGICRLPFDEVLVEFSVDPAVTRFVWLNEVPGGIAARAIAMAKAFVTVPAAPALVVVQAGQLAVRDAADERDAQAVALGAAFALLMLNIRGIDRQLVVPTRLNAARQKSGKSRVPDHIVLRIGLVYGRDGKPCSAAGLKCVYMRAGHVRHQAFGPGWRDHRHVYIAPQLVNYRDGDDVLAQKPRVVRMGAAA